MEAQLKAFAGDDRCPDCVDACLLTPALVFAVGARWLRGLDALKHWGFNGAPAACGAPIP